MNPYKARKMSKIIAIVIVVAMVVTSLSVIFVIPSMFGSSENVVYAAEKNDLTDQELAKEADLLQQYLRYIKNNYKDKVTLEMLMEGAFTGAAGSLEDPYSEYYPTEKEKNSYVNYVNGEFAGVGIEGDEVAGGIVITELQEGLPAERGGIKVGDIITHIDNISVSEKDIAEVMNEIKGIAGTKVSLSVKRNNETLTFDLVREVIRTTAVKHKMLGKNVGYINITSFDNDVDQEFQTARQDLIKKGAKKFILDIRFNGGGFVDKAINIAQQIMPMGPIAHYERQGEIIETFTAPGVDKLYPTVLLINAGTASSSELLAVALKESKAATLVGTQTYGKGVAQSLADLDNGSSLKLSINYVLSPNKNHIDHVGVAPDFVVENYSLADREQLLEAYLAFAPMKEKTKPRKDDLGLNVYGAQQRLSLLGYTVDVNGTMDDKTISAIKAFQRQKKLAVYACLDFTTQKAIEKAVVDSLNGAESIGDAQLEKAIELLN